MNNIKTISNIGYEGFVNFKIYEKNKLRNNFTIHNAGQAGLFNFLATCLSGTLEAASLPKYLSFSVSASDETTNVQSTSSIQYAEIAVSQGDPAKVTYTWVVPITEFSNLKINTNSTPTITAKLTNTNGNTCATAEIAQDSQASGLLTEIIGTQNTNYVIVVAWQLTIGNKVTTQGETINE